ncbi:MAG: methyltransferase domain-containing protein, partial [Acidobacteria bacterium]
MQTRTLTTTLFSLALATGLTAQQPPHTQQGAHRDGTQPHMQHRFEDAEQYARSFDDPARDVWQMPDRVIEALGVQPGQTVADVGAGTGYFTVRLAQSTGAKTIYAVDIEQSMVDYTRHRAEAAELDNVVTVLAGSDRTNLPEPVDLVLIVDTYHHIPDRVAYFTRLRENLQPSGRLAIIDFKKDSPSGPPVEFRFTPDQITGELER